MACEAEYKQYIQSRKSEDLTIYNNCLSRSEKSAVEARQYAAKEAEAQRTAALYSQIHATSAELAKSRLPISTPDYLQYLQTGSAYTAPAGPGFLSKTTSGIGQGILIFGILAGGVLMMMLMFFMVKPKIVQQLPGLPRSKHRKK